MVLLLAVDTTIMGASLGLLDLSCPEYKELWSGHYLGRDGSARILNSLLADGLDAVPTNFGSISQIAVSVGPGSFTGIKVGLAWVYGLAAGSPKTLQFAPMSAIEEAGRHCRQQAGGRALAFVLGSTKTHGYLAEIDDCGHAQSRLINLESAGDQAYLSKSLHDITVILGNDWPEFKKFVGSINIIFHQNNKEETANSAVSGMMRAAFNAGCAGFKSALPLPKYLRQSSAEEKLALQGGEN